MARLDHLEHRLWIEESANNALWRGKSSFQRLWSLHNDKLVHLAKQNYENKQFIYKTELDQLERLSKDSGLSDMGFGREKTTYCYFAVAASSSVPFDSHVRMIVAKSAILITVADDFFDMKGRSLNELRSLIDAIKRWDAKGLCRDGKIIFNALNNLVNEMATEYLKQEGSDITSCLKDIKEKEEGIPNSVLLHLRNNPEETIEEAISYVREMLNKKKEEFLEHVLMDGSTVLPKECRHLHLSCLKVFQMFFNSSNRYDSDTELLDDIAKAMYIPPQVQSSKSYKLPGLVKAQVLVSLPMEANVTKCSAIKLCHGRLGKPSKNFITSSLPVRQLSVTYGNVIL